MRQTDTVDQAALFKQMEDPAFYPHPAASVRTVETHISRVFLAGDYVYKIKKPLDLGFLDFTTLEKRRHFCNREVVLNRRLARDVYLDVVAVTCHSGKYRLGGEGLPVEYAVKMRRLADTCSMK
jgi:aminoglycoside phosphotransferase family enzyme